MSNKLKPRSYVITDGPDRAAARMMHIFTHEKYMKLAGLLAVIGSTLVRIHPDITLLAVIADVAFWWFICACAVGADWKFFRRWGDVIFLIMAGGNVIVRLLNW